VDVILATFSTLPRPASFASVDELHAGIFERLADRRKVVLDWKTAAGFEIGHGCIDSGGISPASPRASLEPCNNRSCGKSRGKQFNHSAIMF
jgi:hypothetical protein